MIKVKKNVFKTIRKVVETIRGISRKKKIMVAKEDYRLGNKLNWVDGISCCRVGLFGC